MNSKIYPVLMLFAVLCQQPPEYRGPFIEPNDPIYQQRHQGISENKWIRDSGNILILHETLKHIGYEKVFSDSILNAKPFIFNDIYFKDSLKSKILSVDSCIQQSICDSYSSEFLMRRKADGNLEATSLVIREIKMIMIDKDNVPVRKQYYNDILANLIKIEFVQDQKTSYVAEKELSFLIQNGFHQSVYNLLYERGEYYNVDIQKEKYYALLERAASYVHPWFTDDSK